MDITVKDSITALSGDGDALGFITVADNTPFYPGTECWLIGDTAPSLNCIITELSGTTKIRLRTVPTVGRLRQIPVYGNNDMSAYTVVDNARINVPCQVAPVVSCFPLIKLPRA